MTSPVRPLLQRRISPLIALTLVVVGCAVAPTSSPVVSSTPSATGPETAEPQAGPTPSPSSSAAAVEHCGASTQFQLAYDLPGMEAAEAICDITYKRIGDVEATLDHYLPPDVDAAARLPAVVYVHGNDALRDPLRPITEHWKRDGYTNGLVGAASGWVGITFDYRGYVSSDAEGLAAAQQDVLDLLAYLAGHADELRLDPTRICLWASGGGGLPGGWAAFRGEPGPRCVVTFSANLDGAAAPDRDPVTLIERDGPPFFIARGRGDRYAYEGSMRFVDKALAEGMDVVIQEHPGGRHFEQAAEPDPDAVRIIEAALDFLRTNLLAPD